jgi:two-component sensor histidine kinase
MTSSLEAPHSRDRLTALHETGLLDTPPEPAYDRLTRLATRLLKVPVSVVSLVATDRQFFKSAVGLAEPWASLRQTPLSHSICQHVVTSGAPLVVEDASSNPLVCDNPAVSDLGVAAYLGAPLVTPDGYVLGSLCAIDSKPRQWANEDISNLTELASIVMSEIALRKQIARREEAELQQRLLVKELHHRVKNTLAMVGALINLSLRTADNLESFGDSIKDRIGSLSNAHSLLVDRQWGSVSLKELIAGEFKPVCDARVMAEGPDLAIPAADAVYISMGLHELLTNAIKYGALSVPVGHVQIDWSVEPEQSANRLELRWLERGGPPVAKPERSGFGTLLLNQILAMQLNGQVVMEYETAGLRATIHMCVPNREPMA